ncbi:hypothetical protein ACP4OV_011118 [Aristida adscensionis]
MAALRCYCYSSTAIIIPRKSSSKTLIRASMDCCPSSESQKSSTSVSFTSKFNKVYEDKSMELLCYTDENGELVCEGLDEGPRLTWQDMGKLRKEEEIKTEEYQRQRTVPAVAGIDWSSLQVAISMGKN